MSESRTTYLFYRYFDNTATTAERQELMKLINADEHTEDISLLIQEAWETFSSERKVFSDSESETILSHVLQSGGRELAPPRYQQLFRWSKVAAAALVITAIGLWFYGSENNSDKKITSQQTIRKEHDLMPGGNKAVLILANGSKVVLDHASRGTLATQGNAKVVKSADGQIDYRLSAQAANQPVLYNTLSIPRGGQYKIVLPDGTQVWLNAASSLKYPTTFAGKERVVQLEGEAYFEVAKNAAKPFRVQAKGINVAVLGTHFNINAYADEPAIKTTLLEGSVKISNSANQTYLQPGEQAVAIASGPMQVSKVNADEVLAWKNGYFYFNKSSLAEVMRQLSRWYDVDIQYSGRVPSRVFGGEISRSSTASEVLKILELSNVHFRIEEKHIVVMP